MTTLVIPPEVRWLAVDTEPILGGDVGGDAQATESWNVRFRPEKEPEEGLYAIIDEYWYGNFPHPSEPPDLNDIGVTCQTILIVCTDPDDPGGTAVWTDLLYHSEALSCTLTEAGATAKKLATASALHPERNQWNGRSR